MRRGIIFGLVLSLAAVCGPGIGYSYESLLDKDGELSQGLRDYADFMAREREDLRRRREYQTQRDILRTLERQESIERERLNCERYNRCTYIPYSR